MSTLPLIGGVPAGIQRGGGSPTAPGLGAQQSVSLANALATLDLIQGQYDGFAIVGGAPNSAYDDADVLYDTMDVYFTVDGYGGTFTVTVAMVTNWPGEATAQAGFKADTIRSLYAIPS